MNPNLTIDSAPHFIHAQADASARARKAEFLRKFELVEIPNTRANVLEFLEICVADLQDGKYEPIYPHSSRALSNGQRLIEDFHRNFRLEEIDGIELFARGDHAALMAIHAMWLHPQVIHSVARLANGGFDVRIDPESWKATRGILCLVGNPSIVQLTAPPERFRVRD